MVNLAHVRTGLHRNRFQNKLQGRRAENLLFHMICLAQKIRIQLLGNIP